ncbi:Protein of unknown function [Pyronema omphalodes CBS 100304]|uniref:Uncharacterized protein n=1 Tax=Pyronema omphalodes (strain CBS 100304) TaxID=1076935 RepID=U4L316_PYROM|nr:Protein of unknown function [Pyronema omphalodes CBS 100304]
MEYMEYMGFLWYIWCRLRLLQSINKELRKQQLFVDDCLLIFIPNRRKEEDYQLRRCIGLSIQTKEEFRGWAPFPTYFLRRIPESYSNVFKTSCQIWKSSSITA